MLTREIKMDMTNDKMEFPDELIWAIDSPYTIANDIPNKMKVAVKVIIFLFITSPKGTAKFVHIMSSGSGALSIFTSNVCYPLEN